GFRSLVTKLPDVMTKGGKQAAIKFDLSAPAPKKEGHEYTIVNDDEAWKRFMAELKQQTIFAVDTETTELDPWKAKLLGLSFSWKDGQGWYVPAKDEWLDELRPILENPKIKKIGHNMKFDAKIL